MAHPLALLDSDSLSEIMKGRDQRVLHNAGAYLREHHSFWFSIITRYEILRGLHAKGASRQIMAFLQQYRASIVYPMTEEVIDRAAEIYGALHQQGRLILDADILIAATALVHDLLLVTGNEDHFQRIPDLSFVNWRNASRD
jgi:tRNA(fMet)-specific endonuclease VapC